MDQIFLGNRYELHEEIGSGGMAHVFKARDTLLDRTVAIKILKPEYTEDTQFIERFRVEAKAAASLSNSSIVMIYDVGQDDGVYYIIMEYVDGITLKEYIASSGRIPWKEAVTLAIQMTQAIDSAHSNHIIHRDIKPQNVLITRDRKIKITDFGIARAASTTTITTVGNAMGSVHYFSPEQAKGSLTDEKSDIYSLGITLYEMVTGAVPFEGETPIAVALKHIQEPPVPPAFRNQQVPIGLSAVILKSIAKDKYDRYQSMSQMLSDLKKVMKDPSGETLQYASVYAHDAHEWGGANAQDGGAYAGQGGFAGGGGFAGAGSGAGGFTGPGASGFTGAGAGGFTGAGGFAGTGAFANAGGYPREGEYSADGGYRGFPQNQSAHGGNQYDRSQYGDRAQNERGAYGDRPPGESRPYGARGAYAQDGYGEGADGGYANDGYNSGYDGRNRYTGDDRQELAVVSADEMAEVNRRESGGRRLRENGGYPANNDGVRRNAKRNYGNRRDDDSYGRDRRDDRDRDNERGRGRSRGENRGGNRGGNRSGNRGGRGVYTAVFVVVVLVAVLFAIGFIVWIMNNIFNIIQPPFNISGGGDDDNFSVGNYIGRPYENVSEELNRAGIKTQEKREANDIVAEGIIVEQSVERGRILKRDGSDVIEFVVSDGQKRFTVPDYREYDTDARAAEAELRANSLDVYITDEQSGAVQKGYVVRTEPGAGAQLSAGSKITVYRSAGTDVSQAVVPQLIGKAFGEALILIEGANLMLGNLYPEDAADDALVVRQSLPPNSVVDEGVSVSLWFEGADIVPEDEVTTGEIEPTPEPNDEQEPGDTPAPTPTATPDPDAAGETPDPGAANETPAPGDATTTEDRAGTTSGSGDQNNRDGLPENPEPINITIRLSLVQNKEYGDTVKVLVEATPSDTGRTTRLLNRSVKKDDFPRLIDFIIPVNGTVEIKVFYDGELIQTKLYDYLDMWRELNNN